MKFEPIKTQIDDPKELERRGNGLEDTQEKFKPIAFAPIKTKLKNTSEKYTEQKHIASGGMKDIFQVLNTQSGELLALAKLRPESPKEFEKPFIEEARLTAALEHANIIKVHEIGISKEEGPFFTMDLKEGETLAKILRKLAKGNKSYTKKYPLSKLLNIFRQSCNAIAFAHSKKILHLDIKPENIQVDKNGEVLLFDWGLGKVINPEDEVPEESKTSEQIQGNIKGTPGYMSPEQVQTEKIHTVSADIYSLGAVLYSILTLERPFRGNTQEILKKTIEGDFIPPISRKKNSAVPKQLNEAVVKAMHINPGERFQSVEELIEAISLF